MYDRRLVAGCAAIAFLAVALAAFMLMAPRWVAGGLGPLAQQQLGRSLTVKGGTHLDFSPLALRLDTATLSGATPEDDSFMMAKSVTIPLTLGELLRGRPGLSSMTLTEPEVALVINERGEANWDFPGFTPAAPLTVTLEQARLRYFDERNSQSMELGHVDGVLELRGDGGAAFAGTAVINGRLVRFDADLKSVARVNADGSPLELVLTAHEGSANFSGRLATAKVLSLAGPVSLSSDNPGPALRLLGLPLPEATAVAGPLAIEGALDTAGRAFAIRNATLALGGINATGDIAADLRSEHPKLQAKLTADSVWLDPYMPASGASNGDWGRVPLPFALLKSIDAEVGIDARSLHYGSFTGSPARLSATLTAGTLQADGGIRLANDGVVNFTVKADAAALPPSVSLNLDVQDANLQPLLGTLTGASKITANGDYSADLTATGSTQEELAGTLKGSVRFGLATGHIAGVDLAGLFIAAKQKILEGWSAAPGGTDFDNLNGEARIEDGIATFRGVKMESANLTVTVEGLVDLLRQGIAVSANASANGQPLLPVALIAKGQWSAPKIYPDIPNILTNPEGGFARLQDVPPLQGN